MRRLLIAFVMSMSFGAYAANGILINEYVKAGVNETTGTFGSGGNTPPGLQYDGTGTGTFNNSYDYLTPGSPFDGFSVRLDASGTTTYVNNNAGNLAQISGAWVSTPTSASAIWAGAVAGKFDLQNTYSLPAGQQYIDINTQITMQSAADVLWFGRFIDPDARAAAGDSSATDNVLGYGAIPRTNVAFSEATVSRYALGMYSAATNVGAGIAQWSTDPEVYFNNHASGYGSYTADTYGTGDDTIGLGFKVVGVGIGDIVNFNYAYIFGPSAFGAATSAVDGGAGGGTPGTVPGGGTLVDVGSATDAATSGGSVAPTVVSTSTATIIISESDAVNTSLPVVTGSVAHHVATEASGSQTIARETTTTVTTPMTHSVVSKVRTTSLWSDDTSTYVDASPTTATSIWNDIDTSVANDSFMGRIDQQEQLAELNVGINRTLNSDAFRKDLVSTGKGRMFLVGSALKSKAGNGYDGRSDRFGIGFERDVKDNWIVGAQYNRVTTNLNGVDSKTTQDKNHVGVYSIYTKNDWILKTDLAYASNDIKYNRNVEQLFFNAGKTDGNDIWLSNRLYTPDFKGFRPFAGYVAGRNKRDAYQETGSIQSYRNVAGVSSNENYSEVGVRYEKRFNKLTLGAEGGITSDDYKDVKAVAAYNFNNKVQLLLSAAKQTHKDLSTNIIGLTGKIDF